MLPRLVVALVVLIVGAGCSLSAKAPDTPTPTPTLEPLMAPTLTPDHTRIAATQQALPTPTPTATPASNGDCPVPPGWQPYRVRSGDTLASLAARTGHRVRDIADGNCVTNPDRIAVGQALFLPAVGPASVPPTSRP